MPESSPIPAAERQREYQRAYRDRQQVGQLWASAFVPLHLVERLVEAGLISEREAADKKSLGAALVEVARRWSKSVMG